MMRKRFFDMGGILSDLLHAAIYYVAEKRGEHRLKGLVQLFLALARRAVAFAVTDPS
jgi:hypothetical protein